MNRNMKTIRLTESDLHNIIKESVKKIINEANQTKYVATIHASFDEAHASEMVKVSQVLDGLAQTAQSDEISIKGIRFRKMDGDWYAYDSLYGWHLLPTAVGHIEDAICDLTQNT
jgi:hypothetical protein